MHLSLLALLAALLVLATSSLVLAHERNIGKPAAPFKKQEERMERHHEAHGDDDLRRNRTRMWEELKERNRNFTQRWREMNHNHDRNSTERWRSYHHYHQGEERGGRNHTKIWEEIKERMRARSALLREQTTASDREEGEKERQREMEARLGKLRGGA